MKAEAALEVDRRALLLGVRADQRRVDVDHDPLRARAQLPRARPRSRPRRAQRLERPGVAGDPVDQPKRRRVRRDRPEQRLLIAHRAQVRQAVAAVGEHHRQIPDHPARDRACAAARAARPARARARRVRPTRSATSANNAAPACDTSPAPSGATSTVKRAPFAHHPQGDPPSPGSRTFSKPKNPGHTGRFRRPDPSGRRR